MTEDDDLTDEEKAELDRRADELWEGEAMTFDEWDIPKVRES